MVSKWLITHVARVECFCELSAITVAPNFMNGEFLGSGNETWLQVGYIRECLQLIPTYKVNAISIGSFRNAPKRRVTMSTQNKMKCQFPNKLPMLIFGNTLTVYQILHQAHKKEVCVMQNQRPWQSTKLPLIPIYIFILPWWKPK